MLSRAIQALVNASQRPLANADARIEDASTRRLPVVVSGVARPDQHLHQDHVGGGELIAFEKGTQADVRLAPGGAQVLDPRRGVGEDHSSTGGLSRSWGRHATPEFGRVLPANP